MLLFGGRSQTFADFSLFFSWISVIGSKMLLVGLAIALCVFVFFLFLLAYLHMRVRKTMKNTRNPIIYILYVDMILLIIRSAYRVAEYGNLEYHNSISTNETLFYTLDAIEMALLNALWIPFHPGFWGLLDDAEDDFERLSIRSNGV